MKADSGTTAEMPCSRVGGCSTPVSADARPTAEGGMRPVAVAGSDVEVVLSRSTTPYLV